jgi:hypothetical protein
MLNILAGQTPEQLPSGLHVFPMGHGLVTILQGLPQVQFPAQLPFCTQGHPSGFKFEFPFGAAVGIHTKGVILRVGVLVGVTVAVFV